MGDRFHHAQDRSDGRTTLINDSTTTRTPNPATPTTVVAQVAGGQVVAHLPYTELRFLGSPSLLHRDDGGWLASHDVFGRESTTSEAFVYASDDGIAWDQVAALDDLFWPTLFAHTGALFLLGTTKEYGDLVIRRSDDGGRRWTVPADAATGLLRQGRYHTAPVPIVTHDGRLWRAVESRAIDGMEWGHFGAVMLSCPVDADLLNAASWESTGRVEVSGDWSAAGTSTWLEGNAVVGPDGSMINLLRTHTWNRSSQRAAMLPYDEGELRPDRARLITMPGGGSKFTVRPDDHGRYWSLVNTALYDASPTRGMAARNTLSLISSADLERWEVERVVLHHPDDARHGFQYVDWLFDGADLVYLSRTAHDFDGRSAHNFHDSNLITLHRLPDYAASRRQRAAGTAAR